jgi:hypothetical protein
MKHSFKCLMGLLLAAQTLQAQTSDTMTAFVGDTLVNLPSKDTIFTSQLRRPKTIGVSLYSESGSPGMPLAITGRFLLGGYIPTERIAATEERLKPQVRGGLASTMSLNVTNKFFIRRHQMGGIRFNDDAFRLVFQGNGAYMGQTLDARIQKATQWDVVEIGFGFEKARKLKNGKGNIIYNGSINPGWLRSYSAVKDFTANVFTDTLAQNVDVMWGGNVQRATGGFGLSMNADLMYDFTKGPWQFVSLYVNNAGLYYTGGLTTYSRLPGMAGNTVRLEAATTSLNKIFRGDWFGDRVDTVKQQLGLDSSRSSKTLFAPFEVGLTGLHKNFGWIRMNYRYLPGYLPRFDWQPNTRLGVGNLRFYPGISLGGFDTWNINLSSTWDWKALQHGGLFFSLQLEGLESLVMPGRLNGFGAYASVRVML